MQPFIHLHVHSQYSILDGQASIPALVDKAIRDGMKGLALTDHGNMFGIKEFFNLVKKKNGATKDAIKGVQKRIEAIESGAEEVEDKEKELASLQEEKAKLEAKIFKPIFGCEMYVARRRLTDKEATPREIRTTVVNEVEGFSIRRGAVDEGGYHLVVLAKNLKGYHNLVKLVSKGWTDGFYSRPRTDKYELEKYHEGLIVCSACLGGEIPRRILTGDIQGAEEAILWFKNIFGEDYYRITTPQSYRTESQPRNISAATSSERSADRVLSQAWNQTGMYQRRSFRGRRKCRSTRPPHLFEYG